MKSSLHYLAIVLLCVTAMATADEQTTNIEVTYLIDEVAASGCTFVRNGEEYTASEAADHLRMKAKRGKRHYDTTEEFIDNIASKSSWSGEPYSIECAGEPGATTSAWFSRALTTYRTSSTGSGAE